MMRDKPPSPNFRTDISSILLLFLLYVLQGVPLGISATIPLILQGRNVPYTEQAKFSLAYWPFSLKVLVAPIVDAIYIQRIGRRKSWLVPLQYLIALFMFVLSFRVDALMESMNIAAITAMFFMLNFLAATQDVAVDGWALTMLKPENKGYAATCNAVGQTIGVVLGYSIFLALDSASFANKFRDIPEPYGLISLPQFLFFWACVFLITTTIILIFKKEEPESAEVSEQHMDLLESYKNLYRILKLRNIQILSAFFLTVGIGTAAASTISKLKLVQHGVPKEQIAFISIPLIPVKLLIPLVVSRWSAGSYPMRLYINAVPFSYLMGILVAVFVYFTPFFRSDEGEYSYFYYVLLFGIFTLELFPGYTRFISSMAFAAKVSDPAVGGTYMTVINTINNIGTMWVATTSLWLVGFMDIVLEPCAITNGNRTMPGNFSNDVNVSSIFETTNSMDDELVGNYTENLNNTVYYPVTPSGYTAPAEKCGKVIDGYYVLNTVCVILGFLWLLWGRPTILRLQKRPLFTWKVVK